MPLADFQKAIDFQAIVRADMKKFCGCFRQRKQRVNFHDEESFHKAAEHGARSQGIDRGESAKMRGESDVATIQLRGLHHPLAGGQGQQAVGKSTGKDPVQRQRLKCFPGESPVQVT